MTAESNKLTFPKDLFLRGLVGIEPRNEYEAFRLSDNLPQMHEDNRKGRLPVLAALQKAIGGLLEEHLDIRRDQKVLEVGCGDGFLTEMLIPPELQEKVISFDINEPSLQVAQRKLKEPKLFQGNAYQIGIATESVDAIVGLSSFDSLFWLPEALKEAVRCLKPQGKLICIQDVVPDLYDNLKGPKTKEAVNRYHQKLIDSIEETKDLKIVTGRDEVLEAVAVEPTTEIEKRIDPFDQVENVPRDAKPLLFTYDLGESRVGIRPSGLFSRHKEKKVLKLFHKGRETKQDLPKATYGPNEVIEWVRLRFLVAQKEGNK